MAAAVAEAHRVLTRGGTLLDIHPAPEWPRLNVEARQTRPLGRLALTGEDERAFTAAGAALAGGAAQTFEYRYEFETLAELTDYLDDNPDFARAADDVLERAAVALNHTPPPAWLVLTQRITITVFTKA